MAVAYSSRRDKGRMPAASARKMGTWKLAYADFLTALCAFFLVMWIVHGVASDERTAIAQQFGSKAEASQSAISPGVSQAASIAASLQQDPTFEEFGSSVSITAENDFIRIDLTDIAERPLFETGDGALNVTGERLTRLVGQAIAVLELPLMIEGHTDSNPSFTAGYSNWELSSDRANSARRILIEAGVTEDRIRGVSGLADTQPLLQDSPEDGVNRRISIVLVIPTRSA